MASPGSAQERGKKPLALLEAKVKCESCLDETKFASSTRSASDSLEDDINNGRNGVPPGSGCTVVQAAIHQPIEPRRPAEDSGDETSKSQTEKIRDIVDQAISEESKVKINKILNEVLQLTDLEKLLLYLKLPSGSSVNVDPLRQTSSNPRGNRFEVQQTVTWIQTHYQEDPEVSLPKHEVYYEYTDYCSVIKMKPLSTADFGKVMKQAFPNARPRRLGTRGNSKYCYAGLRKKLVLDTPKLSNLNMKCDISQDSIFSHGGSLDEAASASSYLICEWASKLLDQKFDCLKTVARHLVENKFVDNRSMAAFTIISENQGKGNQSILLAQSGGNKHRETQLQLQRKLQEREQLREQKKKLQELKGEKLAIKERRRAASGPAGRTSRTHTRSYGVASQGSSQPATPLPCQEPSVSFVLHQHSSQDRGTSGTQPILPLYADGVDPLEGKENNTSEDSTKDKLPASQQNVTSNLNVNTVRDTKINCDANMSNPTSVASSMSTNNQNMEQTAVIGGGHSLSDSKKLGKIPIPRISNSRQSPKVCIPSTMPKYILVPTLAQRADLNKNIGMQKKYKPIQPKPPSTSTTPTPGTKILNDSQENYTSNASKALQGENNNNNNNHEDNTEDKTNENVSIVNQANIIISTEAASELVDNNCDSAKGVDSPIHLPALLNSNKLGIKRCHENQDKCINQNKRPHLQKTSSTLINGDPTHQTNLCNLEISQKIDNIQNSEITGVKLSIPDLVKINGNEIIQISSGNPLPDNDILSADVDIHINSLENDAIMELLEGSSTSLDQDEELSQYFKEHDERLIQPVIVSNTATGGRTVGEQSAQLSQLRKLLEHNLKPGGSPGGKWQNKNHSHLRELLTQPLNSQTNSVCKITKDELGLQQCQISEGQKSVLISRTDVQEKHLKEESVSDTQSSLAVDEISDITPIAPLPSMEQLTGFSLSQHAPDLLQATQNSDNITSVLPSANLGVAARRRVSFTAAMNVGTATSDLGCQSSGHSFSTGQSSVPPSPNTRRRAFNFTPISPRHTPVPDNLNQQSPGSNNLLPNLNKGTTISQPPSATASPFVSPRSTPNPIRSRHNSGQAPSSSFGTPRSTPYPLSEQSSNVNSPFMSPHATPIPFPRSRHNSSQNLQRSVSFVASQISPNNQITTVGISSLSSQPRSRHSSGAAVPLLSPRSAPMSPMNYTQTDLETPCVATFSMPSVGDTPQMRSRHNSSSSIPPMSPHSAPLSPQTHFIAGGLIDQNGGGRISLGLTVSSVNIQGNQAGPPLQAASDNDSATVANANGIGPRQNFDWTFSANGSQPNSPLMVSNTWGFRGSAVGINSDPRLVRQRHASMGATIHHRPTVPHQVNFTDPLNQEVSKLLQDPLPSTNENMFRSQSVPLHQMLQNLQKKAKFDTVACSDSNYNQVSLGLDAFQVPDSSYDQQLNSGFEMQNLESHHNPSFADPPNLLSASSLDKHSDVQSLYRKNFPEILKLDAPLADDLQTTLEDLRDCDNDFSKFSQELEQNENINS